MNEAEFAVATMTRPAELVVGEYTLIAIEGGWHVKDLDDGRCVDVLEMAYNWRLILSSPKHMLYEHGWCYYGFDTDESGAPRTMVTAGLRAIAAAIEWDGTGAPDGYDKQAC